MSKPEITLEPSQGVLSAAASRIFAAYVAAGRVKDDDVASWIKRSIREAVAIAKIIGTSIESHDALAIEESIVVRPNKDATESDRAREKSQTDNKKSRSKKRQSRKTPASKSRKKSKRRDETLEELAQEVLMDEDLNETTSQPRTEHQTEKSSTEDTTSSSSVKQSHEPESKDSAAVAEELASVRFRGEPQALKSIRRCRCKCCVGQIHRGRLVFRKAVPHQPDRSSVFDATRQRIAPDATISRASRMTYQRSYRLGRMPLGGYHSVLRRDRRS